MPSALDGAPIVKRAVCACCAQPAIVASRFSGLLSSYMQAHHAQPAHLYRQQCAPITDRKRRPRKAGTRMPSACQNGEAPQEDNTPPW